MVKGSRIYKHMLTVTFPIPLSFVLLSQALCPSLDRPDPTDLQLLPYIGFWSWAFPNAELCQVHETIPDALKSNQRKEPLASSQGMSDLLSMYLEWLAHAATHATMATLFLAC